MAETLERTSQSVGRFRRTAWSFQRFGNKTARNKRELLQSDFSVTTKLLYLFLNTGEVAASKMTVGNTNRLMVPALTHSSKKQRQVIDFSSVVFAHQKPSDTENVRFYNQLLDTQLFVLSSQ